MHDARSPSRLKQSSMAGVAAALFAAAMLASPAQADPLPVPTITDVSLDKNNHMVVQWRKEPWQGSVNVKWSRDNRLGAPVDDYGTPLGDCEDDLRPNPAGDSQWLYGTSCKGDDVVDEAINHVVREKVSAGSVYYFQVTIAGESHGPYGGPCRYDGYYDGPIAECLTPHYSEVFGVNIAPPDGKHLGPIDAVKGKGTIIHNDGTEDPAVPELLLQQQDRIVTQGSPLKLTFANGSAIALDRKSDLAVSSASSDCSDCLDSFTQRKGRIWYSLKGRPFVSFDGRRSHSHAQCTSERSQCTFVAEHKKGRTWYQVYGRAARVSGDSKQSVVVKKGFETVIQDATKTRPTKPRRFRPLKGKPFWKL